MNEDTVLPMLTDAFVRLGAATPQARVMAGQLLKRARQLAVERGVSEEAALATLLEKAAAGHRGDYPGETTPEAGGGSGKSV